jgi:hypothetical protein
MEMICYRIECANDHPQVYLSTPFHCSTTRQALHSTLKGTLKQWNGTVDDISYGRIWFNLVWIRFTQVVNLSYSLLVFQSSPFGWLTMGPGQGVDVDRFIYFDLKVSEIRFIFKFNNFIARMCSCRFCSFFQLTAKKKTKQCKKPRNPRPNQLQTTSNH